MSRASWSAVILALALGACAGPPALAQRPVAPEEGQDGQDDKALVPREVGGHLIVTDETVVVTGSSDVRVRDASVATKIETPLIETPRSVTVIDRDTLDEIGAVNVTQGHDYAVGVVAIDERGLAVARGFPVDFYDLRRDGLRTYAWSVRELVAVDRLQYLRGPSSVLYGDGSPGALVNMVLKKPLPVGRHELGATVGGAGLLRGTVDSTGPLTADRRVRYRLIAAVEGLENGFDNDEQRITLLPTFAFDIGAGTLTVDTEWFRQRGRAYRHLVPATAQAQRGDFSGYPFSLNVNAPDQGWVGSNVSPGLRYDVAIGDAASLHVAGRYTRIDGAINGQGLVGLAPDGRTALRLQYDESSEWHEYQGDAFAALSFRTGRLAHRVVTGVEMGLSRADRSIATGPATPLDIQAPAYPPQATAVARLSSNDVFRAGVYASDQVRLGRGVTIVPSVRWSHLGMEQRTATAPGPRSSEQVITPALGLVWLPRPWWSLYGNASRGFEPPTPGQFDPDGRALAPARNRLLEVGTKVDVLARRLSLSMAHFRIRRTNVPEADGRGSFLAIGAAESRGLEVEAVGAPTSWASVRSGYALTDTSITQDNTGAVGRALPNAPRHSGHVWLTARLPDGSAVPLTVGAGLVGVSRRFTGRDNVVVAPAYTRLDASVWYRVADGRLAVGLIGHNLTNRQYATSGAGATFVVAPLRRVSLQCTTMF